MSYLKREAKAALTRAHTEILEAARNHQEHADHAAKSNDRDYHQRAAESHREAARELEHEIDGLGGD